MLIRRHGETRRGMSETFAHHLDRHSFLEEQGGVRVPEVVEAQAGHAGHRDDPFECLGEGVGVDGRTVG